MIFDAIELVHGLDDNEDDEGNEKEINDILDEIAVGDVSDAIRPENVGNIDSKRRKIEATSNETRDRHNNVIDERFDDSGEGATNGDTDSEIDDAAAINKFFKLAEERTFSNGFDRVTLRFRFLSGCSCAHNNSPKVIDGA